MTNVIVSKKRTIHVNANGTAGIIQTSIPVTLKNIPSTFTGNGVVRLDHLQDVNAVSETDGQTLVYDETSQKWVAKTIAFSDISGSLDGGSF